MAEQAQEYWFYFDNSPNSSRKVHTKTITAAGGGSLSLSVERIDEFNIKDMPSQGQESTFILTNTDPPPIQPDGSNNPSHEKVHYVRYFPDNDSQRQISIDVELIDELKIKVMADQAQEWIYYIRHPEIGDVINDPSVPYVVTKGYCDPSLELAPETSEPIRLDPFQNIVRIGNSQPFTIFWAFQAEVLGLEFPSSATGYHFRNIFGDPTSVTLPDGRVGIVGGTFPTVSDVTFPEQNTGDPEISFLAWPWWIVGENTDDSTASHAGYNYYDISDQDTSGSLFFSHTWPFFGYTYQDGLPPAIFVPAGELSVSFGPVTLTVEGTPWTLTNIHVAFFAISESDFGATPNSMNWLPFFSATFEAP